MSTKEIAEKLAAYCRTGDFAGAQKELYAEDAVSIEPYSTPAFEKETKGLPAITRKGEIWDEMVAETHQIEVSEPLIAGSSFAITMRLNVTMKQRGPMDIRELCVYGVKDGKIVSEQFFI